MSLRATANYSQLILRNENRIAPIFPGINLTNNFSYSIWVRAHSNIPTWLVGHNCQDGSQLIIMHDGSVWQLIGRNGITAVPVTNLGHVTLGRWTLFCVTKSAHQVTVYRGTEVAVDAHLNPVELVEVNSAGYSINSDFYSFVIAFMNGADICCFKFWNDVLTKDQLQVQAQRWDAQTEGFGPSPVWASPLRTTGDISSIADPHAVTVWAQDLRHGYNQLDNPENLITVAAPGIFGLTWPDPAYMGVNKFCPVWIPPTTWPNAGHSFIDPGMSPATPITYEAPQLFQFLDTGSVPILDYQIESIKYYGLPSSGPDTGWPHSETWGLYFDEDNVKYNPTNSLIYRFEPTTGVTVPGPISPVNMYRWKFGAQFTYQPTTPQQATATANLSNHMLLVTYLGFPSGKKFVPGDDLSGLFAITKAGNRDIYNNNVELKIPDPTIRTAYIGE